MSKEAGVIRVYKHEGRTLIVFFKDTLRDSGTILNIQGDAREPGLFQHDWAIMNFVRLNKWVGEYNCGETPDARFNHR